MFSITKNYDLITLNYILFKMGIRANLSKISKVYGKEWNKKNLQDILDELSIHYNLTTQVETTPCILINDKYALVVLDENKEKIKVWDPRKKSKSWIMKKESFLYLNIKYLNNSQLNILSIFYYVKEKYNFFCKNIILTILFVMLSCFKSFLIGVIGYLCYMNLDYYLVFVDFINMIHNMIICFLIAIGIIILINISNVLINKIVKGNNKNFILGECSYFKLLDFFIVGLLLSAIVYYNNKIIGFIMIIHMLGIIFLNKNTINYGKSTIKNINYLYLVLNSILFITLLLVLIFNDQVGFSYLPIPIFGYLYIITNSFNVQKYYENINNYIDNLKEEILSKISTMDIDSKFKLSKPENLYLCDNSNIEIEKNKITLIFDKNYENVSEFLNCLKNNGSVNLKIFFGKEKIENYLIDSLKDKVVIINNCFHKKYVDFSSVYKNDFEEMDKVLNLKEIYNKKKLYDTDFLIINVCQVILNNSFYIIFDNVLSRFNDETINKILKICKFFNVTVIVLEQKNIDNKYIDNVINWNEEMK